jgi:hypothetical protein
LCGTVDYSHYTNPALNDLYLSFFYGLTDRLWVSVSYGTCGVADASDQQEWDFGGSFALGEE